MKSQWVLNGFSENEYFFKKLIRIISTEKYRKIIIAIIKKTYKKQKQKDKKTKRQKDKKTKNKKQTKNRE